MKEDKLEYTSVVKAVSGFAGGLIGTVVVTGREIADCAKNLATATEELLSKVAEKSVKTQAKKQSIPIAKEKTTVKQVESKGKTGKPKSLSGSQSRPKSEAGVETTAAVETKKPKPQVTRTKESNVKSRSSTAKTD